MNNLDLTVLRALARLSRMRKAVDCEALAVRAGGSHDDVRAALGRLSRASLVDGADGASALGGRSTPDVRLTLAGLAVAVASGGQVARQATRARPSKRHAA
jgi:hypothetical protein